MNKLLLGDNLEILKTLESESVDLIYLDPPFFSNRNYEVIWGDKGEIRSFEDRWSGGIDHYIAWLKERVEEMYRILKPTGSIFLHCDWHANAEIKVFILNKIFGENNFRNEIIWHYGQRMMHNSKKLNSKHDTIFFYAKTESLRINPITEDWTKEEISKTRARKIQIDENGKEFIWDNRSVSKGYSPKKQYIDDIIKKGKAVDSVWDIGILSSTSLERIGYPTQKPEALLERIILCASNENDVILDPFVGGGTTVAVADKLKRNWIGIDQSVQAIKVSELRLQKQQDLFSKPFVVQLHKYDYDTLRYANAFEFETWIIQQYGGISNTKQRSDFGLDGKTREGIPIQVKRSDNIGRNVIDNFQSACKRFDSKKFDANQSAKNTIGIIIAFSFGKGAIQEVARLKNQENIIIELVTVEQIIPIAKKPKLTIEISDLGLNNKELREIEFTAQGESEAGIEFYAWDFDYQVDSGFKANVMIDKEGKQCYKFKTGSFQIAVKVVDNDGLESVEIVDLKINGEIKRN